MPDVEAQREAMRALARLVGKWSGSVRIFRPSGEIELIQTEEASFKLDGLLFTIEGIGRSELDAGPALWALGIISYDDEARAYRMLAFNDGRWLETEVAVADDGREFRWGFSVENVQTSSVLRIDGSGDWTESHEIRIGAQPPKKLMELRVSPQP
jgi:hypothetical protein